MDGHRRAHVKNRSSVYWDVSTDAQDAWIQPDGAARIPLLSVTRAEATHAQERLETVDTTECTSALRECFEKAPPEVTRLASADDYYSTRACNAMRQSLSCSR